MFNRLRTLLLVALVILLAVPVYSVTVATMGAPDSSGVYPITVDHNGQITVRPTAALLAKYELATTSDTILASESGKHFVVEAVPGKTPVFTLPDADVGLEFTFSQGNVIGDGASGIDYFVVDVQDTDFIIEINSNAGSTYAAGNSIKNNGYTADSIHFICVKDLYWYAINKIGTWTDNN